MSSDQQTYYLTRYALSSKGKIKRIIGSIYSAAGPDYVVEGGHGGFHKIGRDVFSSEVAAITAAENARTKKIASLRKQIAALEKMTFIIEEPSHAG